MRLRSFFPAMIFGVAFAAWGAARDSITITKVEDIHITDPEAVSKVGVMEPNNGNSKMLQILGFKC